MCVGVLKKMHVSAAKGKAEWSRNRVVKSNKAE
jgi:hypothetical protein